MKMQREAEPLVWDDGLLDSKLEPDLTASIENARRESLPRVHTAAQPIRPASADSHICQQSTALSTAANSTLSQLIGGCGVAAIDGYLAMKDYAASKGLDLVELHHKGIDLQDLLSTLVIHTQRMAELEGRATGAQRWKR